MSSSHLNQPPVVPTVDDRDGLTIALHHHSLPALVVQVTGELDAFTAPRLQTALHAALREPYPVLVVDLTAVQFMGSAGLAVLADIHERSSPHTTVRVVAPGRATLRPIQVTGLDSVLHVYHSRSDALTDPAPPT